MRQIDQPLVSLHDEGVYGLFDENTVDDIVILVQSFKNKALTNKQLTIRLIKKRHSMTEWRFLLNVLHEVKN